MEQGLIKNPVLRSYLFMALYEYLGMIFFLVGINCSQNDASVAALGLFIAATLTGRLSGGHFNMAITFAVYLVEGKWLSNAKVAISIAFIDILGAFTAMFISIGLLGGDHTFALVPDISNHNLDYILYLLLIEGFFTMVFVSMVLFVKYRTVSSTSDGMLSNLTVAIGLYEAVMMAGPLSGGGVNPTIATAIICTDAIRFRLDPYSHNDAHFIFLIPYIIGPLAGGAVAAGLLKLSQRI